jgi:hypothetical protein
VRVITKISTFSSLDRSMKLERDDKIWCMRSNETRSVRVTFIFFPFSGPGYSCTVRFSMRAHGLASSLLHSFVDTAVQYDSLFVVHGIATSYATLQEHVKAPTAKCPRHSQPYRRRLCRRLSHRNSPFACPNGHLYANGIAITLANVLHTCRRNLAPRVSNGWKLVESWGQHWFPMFVWFKTMGKVHRSTLARRRLAG